MKRRNTQSKQEILAILKSSKSALSQDVIQSKLPEINRATIYRVLNRFCEDGIVHRVTGDDGKQYFAICKNCKNKIHRHNHFHFRCVKCGTIDCLKNEIKIELPKGYTFENFNGVISGLCNKCT